MRIKKIWTKIKDSLIRPVQDKKCFCGRNAAGAADQRGA